jgi:hypothetical protein
MSVNTANATITSPPTQRPPGRGTFWGGIGLCLLGLALFFVQFGLKQLFVPWYSPALATAGAGLLLLSVTRRRSVPRIIVLVLVTAFAGLQWYFLAALTKLPDYAGPARAGKQLPPFRATFADGRPFTEADLRDGSRRVMTFFRGRW